MVRIVGAGFTGLVAAYELVKLGHSVEVFEQKDRVGGLISTINTSFGMVETAANGVLNTVAFEELCRDIQVTLVPTQKVSRKRFIFRNGKLSRWPLSLTATVRLLWGFAGIQRPVAGETVAEWGKKNFGEEMVQYLLAPALQGIYAGDVKRMSSSLIFNRFFTKKKRIRPKLRGSVSPDIGMGELMRALRVYLQARGVVFHLEDAVSPLLDSASLGNTLIATSAVDAGELLKNASPKDSEILCSTEMLPLVRATLFFKKPRRVKGFGALFPKQEGLNSLGVLFDESIFDRSKVENTMLPSQPSDIKAVESWILGGAFNPSAVNLNDQQILDLILNDRQKVLRAEDRPEHFVITRWPKALPHYTCELETKLQQLSPEIQKHLLGNYLGRIGLSQILEWTQEKVRAFAEDVQHNTSAVPAYARSFAEILNEKRNS